jgi:hypothetical protein
MATLPELLDKLHYWLKLLNQLHTKPGASLKHDRLQAKDQLVTWLEQEIGYIETKKQLTLMLPTATRSPKPDPQFKVNTNLSVPQLALFIRLLREVGIISNKNLTEVIGFFARHFSSPRSEKISADSLRLKYYNSEKATSDSVQSVLTHMLEFCKKMNLLVLYATSEVIIDNFACCLRGIINGESLIA